MSSIDAFVAWWNMIITSAEEMADGYESGKLKLFRDGEDISTRAAAGMRRIIRNMEAMIAMAEREKLKQDKPPL